MSNVEQSRQPKGSPDGGEWSNSPSAVAAFDPRILSDEDYNADGSFEYPPDPRSAEQVLSFWMNAKVPDVVLENLQVNYRKRHAARAATARRAVTFKFDGLNADGYPLTGDEAVEAKQFRKEVRKRENLGPYEDAAEEAYLSSSLAIISDSDIRTAARVASAYHQAASLSDVEREKVMQHPVYLSVEGGKESTVAKIENVFQLNAFRGGGGFKDPTRWVGNQIADLASRLD